MTADDRAAWLEWRACGIGASDIAALLGLSNYASPYSLWCEKTGLLPPAPTSQRQRIGQVLEGAIATLFHEQTGLYVAGEQTSCTHPEYPWVRCTVDGFVFEHLYGGDYELGSQLGTHEVKTDGRFGWDGVPVNIRAQCIWQLGVTGLEHCWLSVLHAGFSFRVYEIDWDEDAQADWKLMLERAEQFWFDHVVTGTPPPVDGSDATTDALRTIHPDHVEGETVELDGLADIITERFDLKEVEADTKARLKVIDNQLRDAFGAAEVGTLAGLPILTYRSHERAAYEVAASTVRTLRTINHKGD